MRIKRIAKIAVFSMILLLVLSRIYKVLSWKDTAGNYLSSLNSFYELEEDLVDVFFLGSSHCYCSVNNSILWEEQGIASFGLSISGQDLASSYHTLKEGLKTQKPKVVGVELYGCTFEGYLVEGNLYRNTLSLKTSLNSYELIDSIVSDRKKSDFLLKWPIIHTRYAELQKKDFQNDLVYMGYQSGFENQNLWEFVPYQGEEVLPIAETNEEYIHKIIQLAQNEGIELFFFVSPYNASDKEQKYYKYAQELIEQQGVPVINMINMYDELNLDITKDFIDATHTNYYGSKKITQYLSEYLKENYDLPDRRKDTRYQIWEEDAKLRNHEVQNHELLYVPDLKGYLDTLGQLEDYIVVIATNGEYTIEGQDLYDFLQTAGIGEEFYTTDGVWIFDNRELIYYTDAEEDLKYLDLGSSDMLVSSSAGKKNFQLDKKNYKTVEDGFSILVYDKLLGTVADSIGFRADKEHAQYVGER